MIAHLLRQASYQVNYILGGYFNEPTLLPSNYSSSDWLIAEIDESDGTIDQFQPEVTVLLNADWDHPDYYTSEQSIHDAFAGIKVVEKRINKVKRTAPVIHIQSVSTGSDSFSAPGKHSQLP